MKFYKLPVGIEYGVEIKNMQASKIRLAVPTNESYSDHHPAQSIDVFCDLEISCCDGTPVNATLDGRVVEVSNSSDLGDYIIIQHDDDYSLYSNMKEIIVHENQMVNTNERIGYSGKGMSFSIFK